MSRPGHHVLYTARTWRSQGPTRELRSNRWLIPPLEPDTHREIHSQIATVPLLDHFTADRVLRDFVPIKNNYLATIGELCLSIEEAIHHPKARQIERELGSLVIHALELQMPLIKEGLLAR